MTSDDLMIPRPDDHSVCSLLVGRTARNSARPMPMLDSANNGPNHAHDYTPHILVDATGTSDMVGGR